MTYKFQDKTLSIEERIDDLLGRMTLEEKVRQMDIYAGTEFQDQNGNFQMDKLLEVSGEEGLGCLQNRYSSAEANNEIQRRVMEHSRLPIPVLFSEEALHGLIWPGCTVFPQQLALAATFEPSLAKSTKPGRRCWTWPGTPDGAGWRKATVRTPTWPPALRKIWSRAFRGTT